MSSEICESGYSVSFTCFFALKGTTPKWRKYHNSSLRAKRRAHITNCAGWGRHMNKPSQIGSVCVDSYLRFRPQKYRKLGEEMIDGRKFRAQIDSHSLVTFHRSNCICAGVF